MLNKTLQQMQGAFAEIRKCLILYSIWSSLGWNDIRQRYRRSALGPWWLTISTGIMVVIIGPLYSMLFGQTLKDYFPFLACGIVLWSFISALINEGCLAYIASEAYIKELVLPLPVYVFRVAWRNVIILGHNLIVLFPVLMLFGKGYGFLTLLWIPGLLAISINGVIAGMTLAMICARYRDVPQIVLNLVQVGLFVTPIMWPAQALGKYEWIMQLNPIYHFLELVRAPLLDKAMPWYSWLVVSTITLGNFSLAALMISRFRTRVAYWL